MSKAQDYSAAADVLTLINRKVAHMNPALQRISRFISDNPDRAKSMTIHDLSVECSVAESTVTRFVRELGFVNFAQLKIMIAESVVNQKNRGVAAAPHVYENITSADSVDAIMGKLIHRNVSMLSETRLRSISLRRRAPPSPAWGKSEQIPCRPISPRCRPYQTVSYGCPSCLRRRPEHISWS